MHDIYNKIFWSHSLVVVRALGVGENGVCRAAYPDMFYSTAPETHPIELYWVQYTVVKKESRGS